MPNVDLIIFSVFLIINLLIGLFYSRGVTNITQYALGNRNFSTSTLTATIVATWIGGRFFTWNLIETYSQGLYFIIPVFGESLFFIFIGYFLAPRMGEFLGKLSVAEAMGDLFGKKARLITAIAGIIVAIGGLGAQFKVSAKMLELVFGTSGTYATIISAIIISLYSTLGGINSVTFTDVIQFFTFCIIIPIMVFLVWYDIDDKNVILQTLTTNPKFNLNEIFSANNPALPEMLCLMAFFFIPKMTPATFQRICMASSVSQAAKSFQLAGVICFIIQFLIILIAIFILSTNPNLDPDSLVHYLLDHYTYTGFKALIAINIMAMVMSSGDSLMNTLAIMFSYDICKPLGFKWSSNTLLISKISTIASSISAAVIALKMHNLLGLTLMCSGIYLATVAGPLLFAIFGFRSSEKSVLIAMMCGALTFAILKFKILASWLTLDAGLSGLSVNIAALFSAHYFLNQKGGWIGIKDKIIFETYKRQKKKKIHQLISLIKGFKLKEFCQANIPNNEVTYHIIGLVSIIMTFINMFTIDKIILEIYKNIFLAIIPASLAISAYFLIYPITGTCFKKQSFIPTIWTLGVFYTMVYAPIAICILSKFVFNQSFIMIISCLVVLIMFSWISTLTMIVVGVYANIILLQNHITIDLSLQAQILLCLGVLATILIFLVKPKEQAYAKQIRIFQETDSKNKEMSQQMLDLMAMKQEFINNLSHEIRTPLHHIGSGAQALGQDWDRYSDKQRKEFAEIIYAGYKNATKYIDSLLDLSNLSTNKISLNRKVTDFPLLVENTIDRFKESCQQDNKIDFHLEAKLSSGKIKCDEEKIQKVIINLLENAMQHSKASIVSINIANSSSQKEIILSIADNGIGIPQVELASIFGPFIQSSYTKKMSGGRGIGLAVCEKLIALHGGKIWAQNNQNTSGVTFYFQIPKNH